MNIIIKWRKMKSKEMDKLTEELNELSRKASKAEGKEKEDLVNKWYLTVRKMNKKYIKPYSILQKPHS